MSVRKKMSAKDAEKFKDRKPIKAKNKKKQERDLEREHTKHTTKKTKSAEPSSDPKNIGGGALRGVMGETMARVYSEMWPGMSTHDGQGTVDVEINEEAYILTLTMICGTDNFKPRRALKIRDAEVSGMDNYCKEHRS